MNADQLLSQAANAARRGALADEEALCRSLLQSSPRHFLGWLVLADILVLANRPGEALAAYETASASDSLARASVHKVHFLCLSQRRRRGDAR